MISAELSLSPRSWPLLLRKDFSDAINLAFGSENPAFAGGPLAAFAVNFSDAFGTWKPKGDDSGQFAATFKGFIVAGANTPTAAYGSFFPGQNVGQATVYVVGGLQATANGQILSGAYTFSSSIFKELSCWRGADRSPGRAQGSTSGQALKGQRGLEGEQTHPKRRRRWARCRRSP